MHKLILLLLAFLWLAPAAVANVTAEGSGAVLTEGSDIERPQRSDLGLCDILVVNSSTTLTAPTTTRVLHDASPAFASAAVVRYMAQMSASKYVVVERPYVYKGYIYLLCCLRL